MVEQIFCVVCGLALFLAGLALSRMRSPDWKSDRMTDHEQRHANKLAQVQRVFRWVNNKLLTIIGGMIVTTAAIPHGKYWMITWSAILFLLLVCILLAMLDALSSLFAYRHILPSTIRGTVDEDPNKP